MRKSIQNSLLLSILFILGACSTEPKNGNTLPPDEVVDTTLDIEKAIKESLEQLGMPITEGTDHWEGLKIPLVFNNQTAIKNIFIAKDKKNYIKIVFTQINGESGISAQIASTGTIVISTDFTLYNDKIVHPEITDRKGFDSIYTLTPNQKFSTIYESGDWKDESKAPETYIVKISNITTLRMVPVVALKFPNEYSLGITDFEKVDFWPPYIEQ